MSSSDFYYYMKLPDTSFNKSIIQFIETDEEEKKINNVNVNAKMIKINLEKDGIFDELKKYMLDFCKVVSEKRYNKNILFKIFEMWAVSYKSLDYVTPHDHWPATWSLVYYLNSSKDFPGIYFTDLNEELIVEDSTLVLFPGWMQHEVKRKEFDGKRYVVVANLYIGN
jgi:hypothetical protein